MPRARRDRSRRASVAVAGAALLLGLLALEIPATVGWVDYRFIIGLAERRAAPERQPYDPLTDVRHEVRGDLVPYYGLPRDTTRTVAFRTDRHGFRNATDPDHAAVIVLGDSFVQNSQIPDGQVFTTVLSQELGVSVANLGHDGWGPHRELGALRDIGLGLDPRVVVWVFYEGNDLADTLSYNGQDAGWVERSFLGNAHLRLAALVERVRYGETRTNYAWPEGGPPFGSCRLRCGEPPCERMYFGNLSGPISLFEEVGLARVFDMLADAVAATRRHGAAFVLVYAPVTLRVYHDLCEFDEDNAARRSTRNDLPERMRQWATSTGVGFIDLTPALTAAAVRGVQVYFPDDTHWTELGNAVVADVLASDPAIRKATARPGRE